MRFFLITLIAFLTVTSPAQAARTIQQLKLERSEIERAGLALDQYLARVEAKGWIYQDIEGLPPELHPILQVLGVNGSASYLQTAEEIAQSFAPLICSGQYATVVAQRRAWSSRLFTLATLQWQRGSELSDAWRKIEQDSKEIIAALIDGHLLNAAAQTGCVDAAMRYGQFAQAEFASSDSLAWNFLAMSRTGIELELTKHLKLDLLLKTRASAIEVILERWPEFSTRIAPLVGSNHALVQFLTRSFIAYEQQFVAATSPLAKRRLQLGKSTKPQISSAFIVVCRIPYHLGLQFQALMTPRWPSAIGVLQLRGDQDSVVALALAKIFDLNTRLSDAHMLAIDGRWYEPQSLIWATKGLVETRAELERAMRTVRLSAKENGVATITIFGNEILLDSGQETDLGVVWSSKTWPSLPIAWFSREKIIDNFRLSPAYLALSGATAP
jgi:hypothetical protein